MSFNKLKFGSTIGIIGGGQLGKMMAQSAQKMGYKVIVLDLTKIVHVDTLHINLSTLNMMMNKL